MSRSRARAGFAYQLTLLPLSCFLTTDEAKVGRMTFAVLTSYIPQATVLHSISERRCALS